jgi:hypothetical protein
MSRVATAFAMALLSLPPAARRTPDYLGGFVRSEIAKWAGPVKASGAKID